MAKASEQFRQSDVAFWGIVALVFGGIAVMGANISAVIPQGVLAGLHKTRIEGASVEQLRGQLTDLRSETSRLTRENNILTARFALNEQSGLEVTRRVGALEVSVPKLLEVIPDTAQIDSNSLTAAIGNGPALVYEADGGSVVVRQQPMPQAQAPAAAQPLPAPIGQLAELPPPSANAFGVTLGPAIAPQQVQATWQDLTMKLGPLLFGMAPRLVDGQAAGTQKIVVGPITEMSEATALCARLERLSVACQPVPFAGTPMSL